MNGNKKAGTTGIESDKPKSFLIEGMLCTSNYDTFQISEKPAESWEVLQLT